MASTTTTSRDRPHLLPPNRRLRNLVTISLRNLALDPPTPASRRNRGKTIDDDAIPFSLKSPAKMVALREQKVLGHSRSSQDLRSEGGIVETPSEAEAGSAVVGNGSPMKGNKSRPVLARPKARRRSTLEWSNATPQRRQERLESMTEEKLVDCFFSLGVDGLEEPIYVSEVIAKTMNPTFRNIDFSCCGPGITRMENVSVRIWVRSVRAGGQWRLLLEQETGLRGLVFVGKSLDQLNYALPQNAVLFHLTDGIYTSFTSLSDHPPLPAAAPTRASTTRALPTSSFDALLRLAKLDDSIQDALTTRNKLASDLESLLQKNRTALIDRDRVVEASDRLKTIEYAQKTVSKQLEKARKQAQEKRDSLVNRREVMSQDLKTRGLAGETMRDLRPETPALRHERAARKKSIQSQRRRICEDLQSIYTLTPIPKQPLAFSIRDLRLPDSGDLDSASPEHVAAALGHVAHLLLLLSYYLAQPLLYPVTVRGSTSTVADAISLLKTNASVTQTYKEEMSLRTYPLFGRGVPRFRFEYGVFLLNKNIQLLLESCYGVRVVDIRQTLANVKYLLYVATAGEGELPERKAGGVRGLLKGRLVGGSRGGSVDSMGSTLVGSTTAVVGGKGTANGKAKGGGGGAAESLRRSVGERGR